MIDQYLKPNVKRGAIYYAVIGIVLAILVAIPLLGCLVAPFACVVWVLLPTVIGYLVAQWGSSPTMAMTTTALAVKSTSPYATPAVDGAVASGVGALVSGIVGLIIGLIFGALFAAIGSTGTPSDASGAVLGVAFGAVSGIVGLIVGIIFAAIFGAIGGVLYVALSQRNTPASA